MKKTDDSTIKEKQHFYYMKKIEKWWKSLSEEDKMDVYDNMADFLT